MVFIDFLASTMNQGMLLDPKNFFDLVKRMNGSDLEDGPIVV